MDRERGVSEDRDAALMVETNIFDEEEIIENCTVQILRNSVTGEISVGWWRNDKEEENGEISHHDL